MSGQPEDTSNDRAGCIAKLVAVVLFAAILVSPGPRDLPGVAQRLAAVTALMAVLWVSQAIPIAATSLIPLVAFPLLGIQTAAKVSGSYINQNVFLFLGGFVIALGIEKWGLHRRMALHIVRILGSGLKRVVLGFMAATAFLSMWISNTASTLLMLPIGLAMFTSLKDLTTSGDDAQSPLTPEKQAQQEHALDRLAVVLMLGIAYSASIGGLTTLVGTPTNVAFQQIWSNRFPQAPELSAGEWMLAFVPLGMVFLVLAWCVLVWRLPALPGAERFERSFFTERLRALGRPSSAEKRMLIVFGLTAALWIFRKPLRIGHEPLLPGWGDGVEFLLRKLATKPAVAAGAVHDSTVAIGMALAMFFIPGRRDKHGRTEYLMDWKTAEKLPWGILLLIGGGFALADAFRDTGLSTWLGAGFADVVSNWPVWLVVAAVCVLMTFLTEFTTNVATVSAVLPILAAAAVSIRVDPRLIMIPAAISTSCAFMLPIGTPPNAIVFGSGRIRMGEMARYGLVLNFLGVVLVTLAAFVLLLPQLNISLTSMPAWATPAP